MRFPRVAIGLSVVASIMGSTAAVAQTKYYARERIVGLPKEDSATPPPQLGPVDIVVNGNGTTLTGWSGGATIHSGRFRIRFGSSSVPLTQDTVDVAEAGYTYDVSFSCLNYEFSDNPVSYVWTVTSGGRVLGTGSYSKGSRFAVRSVGTFVGTGAPVRLTISNRYDQDILVDDVSMTRRAR